MRAKIKQIHKRYPLRFLLKSVLRSAIVKKLEITMIYTCKNIPPYFKKSGPCVKYLADECFCILIRVCKVGIFSLYKVSLLS